MKKTKKIFLTLLLASYCVRFSIPVHAQDTIPATTVIPIQITVPSTQTANPNVDITNKTQATNNIPNVDQTTPILLTPVVEAPKRILKPANRKVDLHAIIFDPTVIVKEPENAEEMTKAEVAKYKVGEALKGSVSAVSTKGLLEDTMKMSLEKGAIESIAPWVDYNGAMGTFWTADNYVNETYAINFCDVGVNGKMRDGKTVFRIMISPVRYIEGNTYFQSLFADNYIIRDIGKHNKILVGNTWVPNGIESKESPLTIPFFARSQISRTYGTARAIGTKVMGDYKLAEYQLGVYSAERYFKDFFPGPEFAGVVSFKPLGMTNGKWGKVTMGGSMDAGNSNDHFFVAGAHMIYEYKRWKASFEYASADASNGSTGFNPDKSEGFYGTLAYRITPRLQALIRFDQFDPNKVKKNDIRREYTAGINYFVKGQALKLMLNYVLYSVENGTYGSRLLLGTQIIL